MNKEKEFLEEFKSSIIHRLLAILEVIEVVNNKIDNLIIETKNKGSLFENIQNAGAAKIIKEICEKIDKCECTEKVIDMIKNQKDTLIDDKKEKSFGLHKYSYPNFDVGNASLGSSGNPNAMTWPFGTKK